MKYTQITDTERYTISMLRKQAYSADKIAKALGRHRSTIYREIARNSCNDGHYRPSKAGSRTRTRRSESRRNEQFTFLDWDAVERLLKKDWSPEQVSGYLRKTGRLFISHETIYLHIWNDKAAGGTLYQHLRGAQKKRRKRYQSHDSRGRLAGKRMIQERPTHIDDRLEPGHWEIDTVLGKGSKDCIVTLVERTTRYSLIGKLKARTKQELNNRLLLLLAKHTDKIKSITADNGTEFHGYKDIERMTNIPFYFATPHHSWERGTNENTNGLIRQYLPKGQSMAGLTQQKCNAIANKLNARPRKTLGFNTPEQLFHAN